MKSNKNNNVEWRNKRIGNRTIKVHYDRVELSLKFRNKIFPAPLSKLSHHYFRLGVFDA